MISHSNSVMSFGIDGMKVIRGGVRCSGVIHWQVITEWEMGIICRGIVEHMCSKLSINRHLRFPCKHCFANSL
jgi:hypothetical protein